jgi:hypothetical protein
MNLDHHAYYIEDSLAKAGEYETAIRAREGFAKNSPQFIIQSCEVFGIDEARALQNTTSLKVGEGVTIFFIATSAIPHEAQQALLKLFEEPQEGLVFVLLVPHGTLLPTLRSRFLEYPYKLDSESSAIEKEAHVFLASPYKTRSEWLTKFLKGEEENTRTAARDFINALEAALYPQFERIPIEKWELKRDIREGLQDIAHFRQYLSDRSPSLKMIFEHLAATLPTIKA